MTARVTDWALAMLVAALAVSGALTALAGSPRAAWVFAVHDGIAAALALVLVVKLRRVWSRVANRRRWDRRTGLGATALALAGGTFGAGALWANGARPGVGGYSLLSVHDALGAVLVLSVAAHMVARAKRLRGRDLTNRRQFLIAGSMAAASLAAWQVQRPLQALLRLGGARRRFTGSYDAGSFTGNAFPTTSWVADGPRRIAAEAYRLRVEGLVGRRLALGLADLPAGDVLVATLDCTGGFYSTQRWRGVCLARLLDLAEADRSARHVSVASATGYRWSFPIADAGKLLLATQVGEEALSHEHGAPVRLVAPGRRGFQWVKWVERIELREDPDYGAPASTVWSSFTAAGRGAA